MTARKRAKRKTSAIKEEKKIKKSKIKLDKFKNICNRCPTPPDNPIITNNPIPSPIKNSSPHLEIHNMME